MKRTVWLALSGLLALAASWVLGAVVAAWFSPGVLGSSVGLIVALLSCVAFPVWVDWRVLLSTRKTEQDARSTVHQTLAIVAAVVLAILLFAVPTRTRGALASHGNWVSFSGEAAESSALLRWSRSLGAYIPRSEFPVDGEPIQETSALAVTGASAMAGAAATPSVAASNGAFRLDLALDEAAQAGIRSAASATGAEPIALDQPVVGPAQVFRKYADSVVLVKTRVQVPEDSPFASMYGQLGLDTTEGFGSGFVVSEDGWIVTNHHVISDTSEVLVQLRDGTEFRKVTRLVDWPTHDLALLRVDATGLRPLELAANDAVAVGDPAIAIGSPLGLEYSLTTGVVSALRSNDKTHMIQMQTTIAPGSSGGPLFSNDGKLIGVNVATHGAGLNYAIRVQHVRELLTAKHDEHVYVPFSPSVRATAIEARGTELGPTERAMLAEGFKLLGTSLRSCTADAPDGAAITYRFSDSHWSSEPSVLSEPELDLGACRFPLLRIVLIQLRALLQEGHADRVKQGFSVTSRIEGLPSKAKDAERHLRLTLEIRTGEDPKPSPSAEAP